MAKNKIKVFISYANEDRNKVDALERALLKTGKYELVIVAKRRDPMKSLALKVKEGIDESDCFVPILTEGSRPTQWINQEIGFATAKGKDIFPIVEKSLLTGDRLKGFINKYIDLPFSFNGDTNSKPREGQNFRKCYLSLIEFLSSYYSVKKFKSTISPQKVRQGDAYITKVSFQGRVKNGFYDNYVEHLETGWKIWNWDPSTLDNSKPKTPGNLHGTVNDSREYRYDTTNWPPGNYLIHVRVYDHPDPDDRRRVKIAEETHEFEVLQ